jgi:hypothetical protein
VATKKKTFGVEFVFETGSDSDCPPIEQEGFPTLDDAMAWARKQHCRGDCEDNGAMAIGITGSKNYRGVRFCRPRTSS